MEEHHSFEQETQPQNLNTLCALTFIYSGFIGFCALMVMLFAKNIFSWFEENFDVFTAKMNEQQIAQLQQIMNMGSGVLIIASGVFLLILGLSFFGALQMRQGRYRGFAMYVSANGFLLITRLLSFSIIMAVFDAIFIYLYYKNTRALKRN